MLGPRTGKSNLNEGEPHPPTKVVNLMDPPPPHST